MHLQCSLCNCQIISFTDKARYFLPIFFMVWPFTSLPKGTKLYESNHISHLYRRLQPPFCINHIGISLSYPHMAGSDVLERKKRKKYKDPATSPFSIMLCGICGIIPDDLACKTSQVHGVENHPSCCSASSSNQDDAIG